MFIFNIGLQTVGLMRSESPYRDIENELKKWYNMKEIQALAEKDSDVRDEVVKSVQDVKELLNSVFSKLTFEIATQFQLNKLTLYWNSKK